MRWDWYQATVYGADEREVVGAFLSSIDLSSVHAGMAKNGYLYAWDIKRGDRVLASVWWSGNPGIHVKASGEDAPLADSVLLRGRKVNGWEVLPTRVDACVDWVREGLFDSLSSRLLCFAVDNGIKIDQKGDWERGRARTLYLGSRSSVVQLVLYEKGYESGGDKNWVRLEVRVYPAKRARASVASWAPGDAFRASSWVVKALAEIGWKDLQPLSVGSVWRPSDTARQRLYLLRQYGAIMRAWSEDVGGWSEFGIAVGSALDSGDDLANVSAKKPYLSDEVSALEWAQCEV